MEAQTGITKRRVCVGVGAALLLGACASSRVIEHGIDISVQGLEPIFDVEILYGLRHIQFKGKRPPNSGGGWNAYMPIPDSMTVEWTSRGEQKRQVVSLQGKALPNNRLVNWRLEFNDGDFRVFRVDDDPNSKYYFKKPVQIYP